MRGLKYFLPIFACLAALFTANEATEEPSAAEDSSSCYRLGLSQYRDLFSETFMRLGANEGFPNKQPELYINCISFDESQQLETAIVSGRYGDGDTSTELSTELVLNFVCLTDALIVTELERNFSRSESTSCLECANSPSGDACETPCAAGCERCYGTAADCVCVAPRVYTYDIDEVEDAVDDLTESQLGHDDSDIENTIEETIIGLSSCESECREGFRVNNSRICYACGIQFCIECEEGSSGHGECTRCLPHTVVYHGNGRCLFGFLAEVLEVAEEQEHEVEIEEEERDQSRLELAVTLPVVSVAVVAFFIFMSCIAHQRYPHIGETGRTRHRNKPEPTPEANLSMDDSVFRPRPTVRLR